MNEQSTIQQNPFAQFDPPRPVENHYILNNIMTIAFVMVLFIGLYRLGVKVLTNDRGWIRLAKFITGITISTPLLMLVRCQLRHGCNVDWAALLVLSIALNAFFWGVVWVINGFRYS